MARLMSWLSRPGLLKTLFAQARLASRLVREPRVPLLFKAVPLLAVAYIVSPFDFIPDVVPLLGELDDLALLMIAVQAFLSLCPEFTVTFHRAAIAQRQRYSPIPASRTVLDAEWRVSP